jgi:type VI secretion system protein VasD
MRTRTIVAGVFGMALLSGCASPPPPPPPTVINLTLNATADTNPTADNAGAPIATRAYQLTSATNFNGAEFFQIFNADAATLKTDIVKREDFLLAPSASKTEKILPDSTVKSLGIFAAYRSFQTATWRGSADIVANKINNITVTFGHDGITIVSETVTPK